MIDFEVYLERRSLDNQGRPQIQGRQIVGLVPGRGEYVSREGGKRFDVKRYDANDTSTREVTFTFGEQTKGTIKFNAYGHGRTDISPDQSLIVADKPNRP